MGFSLRDNDTGGGSNAATSHDVELDVVAGDLIVVLMSGNKAIGGDPAISDDDGNSYTEEEKFGASDYAMMAWAIANSSSSPVTITCDWGADGWGIRYICAAAFNPDGDTVSKVGTDTAGEVWGTSVTTGTISATEDDSIAIAGGNLNNSIDHVSYLIKSGAPDASQSPNNYIAQWWKIYAAQTSDIDAYFEIDSNAWIDAQLTVFQLTPGGQVYELATTINGQTSTPSIDAQISRSISTTINGVTSTPAPDLQITRPIATTINASTATSAIELLKIIGMAAQINAASSTPTVDLSVIRSLISAISGVTAISPADLSVQRSLSVQIDAETVTSDIDLLLGGIIELATTIAAATQSTSIGLQVARDLVVAIMGQSVTPAVELQLARALQAAIDAQTSTSEIDLLIVGIIELATTIAAQTQTSSANLILQRFLQAVISAQSVTPSIDTQINRALQTQIQVSSATASIAIQIIRALTAQINAGSSLSDAVLTVLREFSASIDSTTLTSAIELVVGGLGVLVDTELISMTTRRLVGSKTADRDAKSKTARRTTEKI